ncbi:MAG: DNA polymerase III subunit beta [Minisyncoccia bacterium]
MKFVALRSNIKEALGLVQRSTGENTNLPILKNILISAGEKGVFITATNLEFAITATVSGKVIENGKVTVPAGLLSNLISNLQSDRLNFESKNENLEIKTDNYTASIQGMPADDFPVTPKIGDKENYLETKGVFLKEAIQQTAVASQFSDLRPELNSILFDFSIETLKLAATDGFRLAEKTLAANIFTSKFSDPFRILIPLRATYELLRIIENEDVVKLYRDANQVLFKTERAELISRLSEGSFPDYSSLTPKSFTTEIITDRNDLLNAIKLAAVFGQRNNELKIAVHSNKKAIEVASADQAFGENNYLLPAKINGPSTETFFNVHYVSDAVRSITSENIFIGLQEETNPALIKSPTDESYFYILKPILKA